MKPGARRILASCYTSGLETVAFVNPDESRVTVLLNPTEKAIRLIELLHARQFVPVKLEVGTNLVKRRSL